ncbi:MAG: hypothetical protein JJ863_22180 [Deltaproteobacteria bacterium]|nr:hypothetical protein [Deltaproteobacteria bacterium]
MCRAYPFVLPILFALACGDDAGAGERFETFAEACAAVDGCGESRPGPTETLWRVQVFRDDESTYRLGETDQVEVPAAGVPLGPLGGSVALVGRDTAGENVDGQLLAFAEVIAYETGSIEDGGRLEVPLEGTRETLAFVRADPSIVSLAVVSGDGEVLVEMSTPRAITGEGVGRRSDALSQASSSCPHVQLLEAGPLLSWETVAHPDTGETTADVPIVDPGPMQRAIVDAALSRMSPRLCASINRIAFGEIPARPFLGGQVWSSSAGDLVLINTNRESGLAKVYTEEFLQESPEWRLKLMLTIFHEAGHASEALINAESEYSEFTAEPGDPSYAGAWLRSLREGARDTIDATRLRKGMRVEWRRLHAGFVDLGWGQAYPPSIDSARDTIGNYDAEETAVAGAMSRYGATSYSDDIADLVAWTYLGALFESEGIPDGENEKEDFGCQAMATYVGEGVPSRYSALYSKLRFLQDLGLVYESDVERCIADVGLDPMARGMTFQMGDGAPNVFGDGVDGQIGTVDGRYVFELVSSGRSTFDATEYPTQATLRIDLDAPESTRVQLVSWPRGAYRIEPGSGSTFSVRLDGAASGDFDVTDGFAYVAESSNDLIEGSVFIREAWRPNAPVPVPQVFDPPLIVRFRLD